MTNGYNGWTNYETWRVNLEFFDGMTAEDIGLIRVEDRDEAINNTADTLESMAHEAVDAEAKGWALDLAYSFLGNVNWTEIAEHMVDDFIAENV